jgi:hypothetical protein
MVVVNGNRERQSALPVAGLVRLSVNREDQGRSELGGGRQAAQPQRRLREGGWPWW